MKKSGWAPRQCAAVAAAAARPAEAPQRAAGPFRPPEPCSHFDPRAQFRSRGRRPGMRPRTLPSTFRTTSPCWWTCPASRTAIPAGGRARGAEQHEEARPKARSKLAAELLAGRGACGRPFVATCSSRAALGQLATEQANVLSQVTLFDERHAAAGRGGHGLVALLPKQPLAQPRRARAAGARADTGRPERAWAELDQVSRASPPRPALTVNHRGETLSVNHRGEAMAPQPGPNAAQGATVPLGGGARRSPSSGRSGRRPPAPPAHGRAAEGLEGHLHRFRSAGGATTAGAHPPSREGRARQTPGGLPRRSGNGPARREVRREARAPRRLAPRGRRSRKAAGRRAGGGKRGGAGRGRGPRGVHEPDPVQRPFARVRPSPGRREAAAAGAQARAGAAVDRRSAQPAMQDPPAEEPVRVRGGQPAQRGKAVAAAARARGAGRRCSCCGWWGGQGAGPAEERGQRSARRVGRAASGRLRGAGRAAARKKHVPGLAAAAAP